MTPETLQAVTDTIEQSQDQNFEATSYTPVSGGDINQSFVVADGGQRYFVKMNDAKHLAMLESESESLRILADAQAVKVPEVVGLGRSSDTAFLILEHCPMQNRGDFRKLARGLAKLHQQLSPNGQFGWHRDNYIGTSPQANRWHNGWPDFWLQERLMPQLELAYAAGYGDALKPLAEQLITRLPDIWGDYAPQPSLLHGDLWGGNAAFSDSGEPLIYDPASYYGDRETDLALTELFGGFTPEFYQEYQQVWPLQPGYPGRKKLYNLYHLLNHLNLFGAGYLSQCRNTMDALIEGTS